MNIVLLGRMAAGFRDEIASRLRCDAAITAIADTTALEAHWPAIEAADVLVGWPLTQAVAGRAANVKLLQASGAGVDGLDFSLLPPHVRVANTFHHEVAIAEYVIMAMFQLTRRPAEYDARLRRGDWRGSCIWGDTPAIAELYGRTVLVIGTGHIAR